MFGHFSARFVLRMRITYDHARGTSQNVSLSTKTFPKRFHKSKNHFQLALENNDSIAAKI